MFGTAGDSSDVIVLIVINNVQKYMFRLGVACASLGIAGIADDR